MSDDSSGLLLFNATLMLGPSVSVSCFLCLGKQQAGISKREEKNNFEK